jgi:hypothetical protein
MLLKIILVSAIILLVNRLLRPGPPRGGRPRAYRHPHGHDREVRNTSDGGSADGSVSEPIKEAISGGKKAAAGDPDLRVQCPFCESWNVTQYRDLRSAYWFMVLLTLGLLLLFKPEFPRVNVCNNCGKRWSFGEKR